MVKAVALWGAELGWRGQRDWEEKFEKLQDLALKNGVNATHGSKRELVSHLREWSHRGWFWTQNRQSLWGRL